MTLAAFADLAEVIGALGVIAGLIFVGVQLNQNTKQLRLGEANTAMAQASAIRLILVAHRDVAELVSSEMAGKASPDVADEMRLNAFYSEATYLAFNAWQRGAVVFNVTDTLERAVAPVLGPILSSPRGQAWWHRSRPQFAPEFVAALENAVPSLKPPDAPPAVAPAPQQPEV